MLAGCGEAWAISSEPVALPGLFRGERPQSGYAFHTQAEENPVAMIDH
jgi:hypothetical protein